MEWLVRLLAWIWTLLLTPLYSLLWALDELDAFRLTHHDKLRINRESEQLLFSIKQSPIRHQMLLDKLTEMEKQLANSTLSSNQSQILAFEALLIEIERLKKQYWESLD